MNLREYIRKEIKNQLNEALSPRMRIGSIKFLQKEDIKEVAGFTLKDSTKKAIRDFLYQEFDGKYLAKNKNISVDDVDGGYMLTGAWTNYAYWKNDELSIHDQAYGNVSQTYLNFIRKLAKQMGIPFKTTNLKKIGRQSFKNEE